MGETGETGDRTRFRQTFRSAAGKNGIAGHEVKHAVVGLGGSYAADLRTGLVGDVLSVADEPAGLG